MSLTPDAIRQSAVTERARLATLRDWAAAYAGAEPEEPLLVKASPPLHDYYIVQFLKAGLTSGLMLIDAGSGKVGSVTRIAHDPEYPYRFLRPHEVPMAVVAYARRTKRGDDDRVTLGQRPALPDDVRAADIRVRPELMWEPCDQSVTPFYPLYSVEHSRPDANVRFLVRIDGRIFTTITTGARGL